jgi:hypothetical protein
MAIYQPRHPVAFEMLFADPDVSGTDLTMIQVLRILELLCVALRGDINITAHARTERFTCGLNFAFTEAM